MELSEANRICEKRAQAWWVMAEECLLSANRVLEQEGGDKDAIDAVWTVTDTVWQVERDLLAGSSSTLLLSAPGDAPSLPSPENEVVTAQELFYGRGHSWMIKTSLEKIKSGLDKIVDRAKPHSFTDNGCDVVWSPPCPQRDMSECNRNHASYTAQVWFEQTVKNNLGCLVICGLLFILVLSVVISVKSGWSGLSCCGVSVLLMSLFVVGVMWQSGFADGVWRVWNKVM
jgi:hypothetical protein